MLVILFSFFVWFRPAAEERKEPPRQPLPFSHRQHDALGVKCQFCHEEVERQAEGGLPATSKCITCHESFLTEKPAIRTLLKYHRTSRPIPWKRVYELPGYVFFNHSLHLGAGATCEKCHGPVEKRDTLRQEKDISMTACVACHLAESAPTTCGSCHSATLQ